MPVFVWRERESMVKQTQPVQRGFNSSFSRPILELHVKDSTTKKILTGWTVKTSPHLSVKLRAWLFKNKFLFLAPLMVSEKRREESEGRDKDRGGARRSR